MRYFSLLCCLFTLSALTAAEYSPVKHRKPKGNEIAVTEPGSYDKANTTYVLTKNINSTTSPIFLGNNVTLDLNGYTITYADGNYQHINNYDFADGLKGWDVKKAPGAQVKNTEFTKPMIGKNSLFLPNGQEIVSPYVELPVANRSYYAMVAASKQGKYFGIYVEDENGKSIDCAFKFGSNTRVSCPEKKRGPKMGGGIVFAHIHGLPAGKYRIRVKALTDGVVIGAIDLRPTMDVGISIVEKTMPWAYYKCILDGDGCAFFDYTKKGSTSEPKAGIPRVSGSGNITIKNGIIKAGSETIRSWAIQSTASKAQIHIDNVKIEASGSNANAISVAQGSLKNSHITLNSPFIIDRHRRGSCAVSFHGKAPSHVSHTEFIGGQGCLHIGGDKSEVHNNIFRNHQTVTNHYSLSCDGNGSKVYGNQFLPTIGSGIYIFRRRNVEVYNNTFEITSAPPNNEYGHTDYSTNAIRISDYNADPGSKRGWCEGNRIYNNTIKVTSQDYKQALDSYISVAYGIFMSVGGGKNYVDNNTFIMDNKNPGSKRSSTYAFYIGGSNQGGAFTNNTVTANTTPVWIGNRYGVGHNVLLANNNFIKAKGAKSYTPIILGYYKHPTKNIKLISNNFKGLEFNVKINDYTTKFISEYEFGWTVGVETKPNTEVTVTHEHSGKQTTHSADKNGRLNLTLAQFRATGDKITDTSSYTITANGKEKSIKANKDQIIKLK